MKGPYILHKAIAIPVDMTNSQQPIFLTVLDKRHLEWIFVTGGCRKTEVDEPIKCAIRELHEETRGAVYIHKGKYSYFQFNTKTNSKKLGDVVNVYHVYVIDYSPTDKEKQYIVDEFELVKEHMNKKKLDGVPVKRAWDENETMVFETLDQMKQKTIWEIINKNVIENPDFITALNSQNRQSFNISTNHND